LASEFLLRLNLELEMKSSKNRRAGNKKGEKDPRNIAVKQGKPKIDQEECCPGWQETFDAALDIVALISPDFEILKLNRAGYANLGKRPEKLVGEKCYAAVHGLSSPIDGCPCEKALKTRTSGTGEISDHGRMYIATASPIFDKNGKIVALAHTVKDITDRKKAEEILQTAQEDLERQVRERTADLDRKNIALQEIINQIEIEKKRMKEQIRINIEKIIFPVLEKIKKEGDGKKYADVLLSQLKDITSSFGITITNGNVKLTPKEIEICGLVRAAYKSKEIASLLHVSCQTVEWHRKKIRSKLRIANRGVHLGSYLHEL